jgi:hypothetical protein
MQNDREVIKSVIKSIEDTRTYAKNINLVIIRQGLHSGPIEARIRAIVRDMLQSAGLPLEGDLKTTVIPIISTLIQDFGKTMQERQDNNRRSLEELKYKMASLKKELEDIKSPRKTLNEIRQPSNTANLGSTITVNPSVAQTRQTMQPDIPISENPTTRDNPVLTKTADM